MVPRSVYPAHHGFFIPVRGEHGASACGSSLGPRGGIVDGEKRAFVGLGVADEGGDIVRAQERVGE